MNYSWLYVPFSEGDFKSVAGRHSRDASASTAQTGDTQAAIPQGSIVNTAVYSCPQEGCVRVFQRSSALERHLSLEACELSPEKYSLMDLAKQKYAAHLQEGVGQLPSLHVPPASCASDDTFGNDRIPSEGWALKEAKKVERFNDNQKNYLEAKFNIGQATGRKLDADVVAKEMRRARGADGERMFGVTEFLSQQQVSSFFSRLAAKRRKQQAQVTEEDVLAVEEEQNFCAARDSILSSLQISHPIVVDQYDICTLVKSKGLKKLKVGLLQVLCENLELEVPTPPLRKKAPYIELLNNLVKDCSCFAD